jgi:hypothetical protein
MHYEFPLLSEYILKVTELERPHQLITARRNGWEARICASVLTSGSIQDEKNKNKLPKNIIMMCNPPLTTIE